MKKTLTTFAGSKRRLMLSFPRLVSRLYDQYKGMFPEKKRFAGKKMQISIEIGVYSTQDGLNYAKQFQFTIFRPINSSYKFLSAFPATSREIQPIFMSENCSGRLLIQVWRLIWTSIWPFEPRFEPRHCFADLRGLTSTCVLVYI